MGREEAGEREREILRLMASKNNFPAVKLYLRGGYNRTLK